MYKNFLLLSLCIPLLCSAQSPKFDYGLSALVFFRQAQTYVDPFSHLFGAVGMDGVLRVNGKEETDISFLLNMGFADDIRKYDAGVGYVVRNSLYFININPSVSIPSRWRNVQFCLGIGTYVRLGQSVSFSWGASDPGPFTTADSVNRTINQNTRSFLPYASLGISKDVTKHLRLEAIIRPTLLNLYEPGTNMNFSYASNRNFGATVIELNYQPVYVGARLSYFFKGNE